MRMTSHPIEPQFTARWSARAFSGEAISQDELLTLLDAARWAPSAMNNQPWRFLYAHRDTPAWEAYVDLLVEANKRWCHRAAALIVVVSQEDFAHNGKPSRTHAFDTGAAWMSLALQAHAMGLIAHGMQGFDYDRAAAELGVPPGHAVQCMVAIGRPGAVEDLPDDLQAREQPSDRRPLAEVAFADRWPQEPALVP